MTDDVHHRIRRFASAMTFHLTQDRDGVTLALRSTPMRVDVPDSAHTEAIRATPSGGLVRLRGRRDDPPSDLHVVDWRVRGPLALPSSTCVVLNTLKHALSWDSSGDDRPEIVTEARRALPSIAISVRRELADAYASFRTMVPPETVQAYECFDGTDVIYGEVLDRIRKAPTSVRDRACAYVRRNLLLGGLPLLTDDGWAALLKDGSDLEVFRAAKAWARLHRRTGTFPVEKGRPKVRRRDLVTLGAQVETTYLRAAHLSPVVNGPGFEDDGRWLASTLSILPPEWVPRQSSVSAMSEVCHANRTFAPLVPYPDSSHRGYAGGHDWEALRDRLASILGFEADAVFGTRGGSPSAGDLGRRFVRDVALPVALLHSDLVPTLLDHAVGTITDRDGLGIYPFLRTLMRGMDLSGRCAMWARHRDARERVIGVIRRNPSTAVASIDRHELARSLTWSEGLIRIEMTHVGRPRSRMRKSWIRRAPNVVLVDEVRVRELLIPHEGGTGPFRCVLHVPADTYEGVIEVEGEVCMSPEAAFDPVRALTGALGCDSKEVGRRLLATSGLGEVLRRPPHPGDRDHQESYPEYEVTPDSVHQMLAAWRPVLPRRLRLTDVREMASALEAEIGTAAEETRTALDEARRRSEQRNS